MTFPFKYYFHWDDGEVLANGLGPNVTPIAKSHVTPVCEDGRQTGAHKMILDFSVVSNASRTLKDGGGTAIGLGPNVNIHCCSLL